MANADGGLFPPPDYYVKEDNQKAVIVYDDNMETLILSVGFSGDAKDFGWVIPTPSRPEVTKSSDELFKSLKDLTGYQDAVYPTEGLGLGAPEAMEKEAVTVLETKKIDIYDIAILDASDSGALAKWLNDNGYQYPEDEAYVLEDYINNQWFFTAVKVSSDFADTVAVQRLGDGHATPLQLTFQSDKIIYPLKISSVQVEKAKEKSKDDVLESEQDMYAIEEDRAYLKDEYVSLYYPVYDQNIGITLYVLADHKKTVPGFTTEYAGWVKPKQIEEWAYVDGQPWMETNQKYYLTKLYDSMITSEMTNDLYIREAEDDNVVGKGETSGWKNVLMQILYFFLYIVLWIISPIGIIFLISTLVQFLGKSQIGHIIAWVFQVIMFLCNLVFVLILNLVGLGSLATSVPVGMLAASYVTIAIMVFIVIMQEVYKRKTKVQSKKAKVVVKK